MSKNWELGINNDGIRIKVKDYAQKLGIRTYGFEFYSKRLRIRDWEFEILDLGLEKRIGDQRLGIRNLLFWSRVKYQGLRLGIREYGVVSRNLGIQIRDWRFVLQSRFRNK